MTTKPITVVFGKVTSNWRRSWGDSSRAYKDRGMLGVPHLDKWLLKLNGHDNPRRSTGFHPSILCRIQRMAGGRVQPVGWGDIAAGEAANEDILIEALDEAIRSGEGAENELPQVRVPDGQDLGGAQVSYVRGVRRVGGGGRGPSAEGPRDWPSPV